MSERCYIAQAFSDRHDSCSSFCMVINNTASH